MRILVVDDDRALREALRRVLTLTGYEVQAAADGEQAIELVGSGAYDVAFLMRPTPVEQVRDIAAAGVNMPPKSTYFFPKLPTGLVFNLLE